MRDFRKTRTITERNTGSVSRYLTEISRLPMISTEVEEELAFKIQRGGKEAKLAQRKLVEANLRFVVTVANQYKQEGCSLEDLINEGNIGLIRAAERFDPTRGIKFISYAVWWIRQAIITAILESDRIVKLPVNRQALVHQYKKFINTKKLNGEFASDDEISEALHITLEEVSRLKLYVNGRHRSIDAPVLEGEDNEETLADRLVSNTESPDVNLNKDDLKFCMREAISNLPPREKKIMCGIYGLEGDPCTLQEIALKLGISRERCRQLHQQAITRLRTAPEIKSILRSYL